MAYVFAMGIFAIVYPAIGRRGLVLLLAALIVAGTACYQVAKPLPDGLDYAGDYQPASQVQFLRDLTWYGKDGTRSLDQEIFDEMLAIILQADTLIVLDQFLFNAFAGTSASVPRRLSQELTEVLVTQLQQKPDLAVWFITDPINTLYGERPSPLLARLEAAGAKVVRTRLPALRDSNPLYSVWWRLLLQFWPQGWPPQLPNPLGEGPVAIQGYLSLLNFKANHRKTLVADDGAGRLVGMVSSANPHDASSAHHNVAVRFKGRAAWDLLQTERAVCRLSGTIGPDWPEPRDGHVPAEAGSSLSVKVLTERSVQRHLLAMLESAQNGDQVQVAMFYLSSRPVVRALQAAHRRGVEMQVLLDPNKDAFGREKNGIPNRPVGRALHAAGIPVRWVRTQGEQFHTKLTLVTRQDGSRELLVGSSNYTRRNLKNLNLETCVAVRGEAQTPFFRHVADYLATLWGPVDQMHVSGPYSLYADDALHRRLLYRIMEQTGMSTF